LSLLSIAAVSTIAFMQVASAADLPRKALAYTPSPASAFSWTGFYVGGNAGYGSGRQMPLS
jgi:outer membrane immunogenic protein